MNKEVIENDLRRIKNNLKNTRQLKIIGAEKEKKIPDNYLFDMDILLAIIEEQQKEINELKEIKHDALVYIKVLDPSEDLDYLEQILNRGENYEESNN